MITSLIAHQSRFISCDGNAMTGASGEVLLDQWVIDRLHDVLGYDSVNEMQRTCLRYLLTTSENLAIFSPTGSGKTDLVAMYLMERIARKEHGVIVYVSVDDERLRAVAGRLHGLVQLGSQVGDVSDWWGKCCVLSSDPKYVNLCLSGWNSGGVFACMSVLMIDDLHLMVGDLAIDVEIIVARVKMFNEKERKMDPIRIVVLSDFLGNSKIIAQWIGVPDRLAQEMTFGEELRRPKVDVKIYGYEADELAWSFDRYLDGKLVSVLSSRDKIGNAIIFCCTAESCKRTASMLVGRCSELRKNNTMSDSIKNRQLSYCAGYGIAFCHPTVSNDDRNQIRSCFGRDIHILCVTFVDAQLHYRPCYSICNLVVMKGTIGDVEKQGLLRRYTEYELLAMCNTISGASTCVILTNVSSLNRVTRIVLHENRFESQLLTSSFTQTINREIAVGTISDLKELELWIEATLTNLESRTRNTIQIESKKAIQNLHEHGFIDECAARLVPTWFGLVWSNHQVSYDTAILARDLSVPYSFETILEFLCSQCAFKAKLLSTSEIHRLMEMQRDIGCIFAHVGQGDVHEPNVRARIILETWLAQGTVGDLDVYQDLMYIKQLSRRILAFLKDVMIAKKTVTGLKLVISLLKCIENGVLEDSQRIFEQIPGISTDLSKLLYRSGYHSFYDLNSVTTMTLDSLTGNRCGWGRSIVSRIDRVPIYRLVANHKEMTLLVGIHNLARSQEDSEVTILISHGEVLLSQRDCHLHHAWEYREFEVLRDDLMTQIITISVMSMKIVGVSAVLQYHPAAVLAKESSKENERSLFPTSRLKGAIRHTTTRVTIEEGPAFPEPEAVSNLGDGTE